MKKLIAKLLRKINIGASALPDHLKEAKHWDYPKGLKWIPRAWTSAKWGVPEMLWGNQKEIRQDVKSEKIGPAPIGEKGSWQISKYPKAPGFLKFIPLYFAVTFKSGLHFRIGARWDDVDSYVTIFTIAKRKYTGNPNQDTSTD